MKCLSLPSASPARECLRTREGGYEKATINPVKFYGLIFIKPVPVVPLITGLAFNV